MRTGVPARARGERAGRNLPPQTGGGRLQGRYPRPLAQAGGRQEWQAHRAGGRRPRLAHGRARPGAARLSLRGVRPGPQGRRHDPHADSALPSAGIDHRRGMRLYPQPRHRISRRQAHRQSQGAAGGRLGCDLRRLGRAAGPRSRRSRPQGSGGEHPYRHRLALIGLLGPRQQNRQARDRARRRQHRHGLLPLVAPSRRRGCESDRALGLPGNEGVSLGKGGRHARRYPDPEFPRAERVRPRERPPHRRAVREGEGRIRRQGPAQPRSDGRTASTHGLRRRAGRGRPGERFPLDRARRRHRVRQMGYAEGRSQDHGLDPSAGVLRRRLRLRPEEHHLGGRPRPRRRAVDRQALLRRRHQRSSPAHGRDRQLEDGHSRVELRQRHRARSALSRAAARQGGGAARHQGRGRARLRRQSRPQGGAPLPQLRRTNGFHLLAVHRVRRLRRHLPDGLHHVYPQRRGSRSAHAPSGAGQKSHPGPLCRERPQDRPRHGQGRGRVPALRAMRGALPDRRLGHEKVSDRHDAYGRPMPSKTPISSVNDFVVRFANVNGSGSASANELFARSVLRMGIPAAPRNIFPSNIQGLPTWYEVRVTEASHLGARGGTDLMVAMNPQTFDRDIAAIEPGGYLLYDSTKPLPASKFRDDITVIGVPLTAICNREYTDPRQRQLFKNIIYIGALTALLDIDVKVVEQLIGEQYKGKDKLIEPNVNALHIGRDYAILNLQCPLGIRLKRANAVGDRIFIEGNSAAALGAVYGGATVCAWYPITPSSSLADAFTRHCAKLRIDTETKQAKYAIIQAEDELASIGVVIGAGWNGARAFTATSGPGISLMQEFIGLAYFAEIPAVLFDVQRAGPSTGMPTRTQQCDVISCAYASHGDTKHVLLFPEDPAESFEFGAQAFDLADRLQTPIFVMLDLDIGMNHHLSKPLTWDDTRKYDRGKVMTAAELEAGKEFGRYLDVDGDGIPYRTYPGTHPTKGSFFTRGTSRDRYARYTEEGATYVDNMQRLVRKFETAKNLVPRPLIANAGKPTKYGVIYYGSTSPAMDEAIHMIEARGHALDRMRVRAFPFHSSVNSFVADHDFVFVVEQNRDAQLRSLIVNECGIDPVRLVPILHYDGTPITARFIAKAIGDHLDKLTVKPMKVTS